MDTPTVPSSQGKKTTKRRKVPTMKKRRQGREEGEEGEKETKDVAVVEPEEAGDQGVWVSEPSGRRPQLTDGLAIGASSWPENVGLITTFHDPAPRGAP